MYPVSIRRLLGLPAPQLLDRLVSPFIPGTGPQQVIERAKAQKGLQITATEVLPRMREGGAFVKFTHDGTASTSEVEKVLQQYLRDEPVKPWWAPFRRMRAKVVKGRPWVEDLTRIPSPRLRVEFISGEPGGSPADAVELSQEELFQFFRPYGKLSDIVMQPPDSKILPKFAHVDFSTLGKSIMAKNCMHGYLVSQAQGGGAKGTILRLQYEPKLRRAKMVRDWALSHPR